MFLENTFLEEKTFNIDFPSIAEIGMYEFNDTYFLLVKNIMILEHNLILANNQSYISEGFFDFLSGLVESIKNLFIRFIKWIKETYEKITYYFTQVYTAKRLKERIFKIENLNANDLNTILRKDKYAEFTIKAHFEPLKDGYAGTFHRYYLVLSDLALNTYNVLNNLEMETEKNIKLLDASYWERFKSNFNVNYLKRFSEMIKLYNGFDIDKEEMFNFKPFIYTGKTSKEFSAEKETLNIGRILQCTEGIISILRNTSQRRENSMLYEVALRQLKTNIEEIERRVFNNLEHLKKKFDEKSKEHTIYSDAITLNKQLVGKYVSILTALIKLRAEIYMQDLYPIVNTFINIFEQN